MGTATNAAENQTLSATCFGQSYQRNIQEEAFLKKSETLSSNQKGFLGETWLSSIQRFLSIQTKCSFLLTAEHLS